MTMPHFQVQSSASDDNYVIVAIPGNTKLQKSCDKDCKHVDYSFVAFINRKQKSAIDNKVCKPKKHENGIAKLLSTSTSIQETTLTATEYGQGSGGSYYFPDGTATASIIYKYKFVAKIEHKLYWSMHFVIKFMPGTPPENQWVRIYIPGSSEKSRRKFLLLSERKQPPLPPMGVRKFLYLMTLQSA